MRRSPHRLVPLAGATLPSFMCCVARAEHLTRRPRASLPWRSASPVVLYTAARCRGLFRLAASGLRLGVSPGPSLGALPGTRRFPWARRPGSPCASARILLVRLGALRVLLGFFVLRRLLARVVFHACGRRAFLSGRFCVRLVDLGPLPRVPSLPRLWAARSSARPLRGLAGLRLAVLAGLSTVVAGLSG